MMKKVLVAATVVMVAMSGSAMAANSLYAGAMGLNIAMTDTGVTPNTNGNPGNFMIGGKYFMSKDMALVAGFGFGSWGSDAKGTDIGFEVGMRKYLKTDDFAPFVQGRFVYAATGDSATAKITGMGILGEFGAEYFFNKQFSMEGKVGFGYKSVEVTQPAGAGTVTTKANRFGTESVGISANFYF